MQPIVVVGTNIPDWAADKMFSLNWILLLVKSGNLKEIVKVPKNKKLEVIQENRIKLTNLLRNVKDEVKRRMSKIVKKIEKKFSYFGGG